LARNFYSVLSLDRNATDEQIRRRFHELARKSHPDRYQGEAKRAAEAEFQAITEAFNVLRDPERRRQHDLELLDPAPETGFGAGPLSRAYVQRGVAAYREGRWIEAADAFSSATGADPQDAKAWHHLALACSRIPGRNSLAMKAIERACELEPMNPPFLKLAGRLFARQGLTRRALRFYNQALEWGGPDEQIERIVRNLEPE